MFLCYIPCFAVPVYKRGIYMNTGNLSLYVFQYANKNRCSIKVVLSLAM